MSWEKTRACEFPIDLRLSVEVWFGYDNDISVSVLQDGVNDVVTRHFSFDELYKELFFDGETIEEFKEQDRLLQTNHAKRVLKRMREFVKSKGIQL